MTKPAGTSLKCHFKGKRLFVKAPLWGFSRILSLGYALGTCYCVYFYTEQFYLRPYYFPIATNGSSLSERSRRRVRGGGLICDLFSAIPGVVMRLGATLFSQVWFTKSSHLFTITASFYLHQCLQCLCALSVWSLVRNTLPT